MLGFASLSWALEAVFDSLFGRVFWTHALRRASDVADLTGVFQMPGYAKPGVCHSRGRRARAHAEPRP
jgi:hypothetical protein